MQDTYMHRVGKEHSQQDLKKTKTTKQREGEGKKLEGGLRRSMPAGRAVHSPVAPATVHSSLDAP